MSYQQKDNTATLFINDRKTEDKHPDYTGKAIVDGSEKKISGWIKKTEKGEIISITFKEPYVRP